MTIQRYISRFEFVAVAFALLLFWQRGSSFWALLGLFFPCRVDMHLVDIVLYFDDIHVTTVTGQKSGDWSASFVLPYVSVRVHAIRAIDVDGRWMSTAYFNVTSSGAGFSITPLLLFGFLAVAALSGLVAFVLLFASNGRKRK